MTEELIKQARAAGFGEHFWLSPKVEGYEDEVLCLERFYQAAFEAGAARERENQAEQKAELGKQEPVCCETYGCTKSCPKYYAAPQPVQSLSAQDLNDLEIETKWAGDSHEFERIVNAAVAKLKPVRTKDLTDDEIQKWIDVLMYDPPEWALKRFARAVIAAFKEKNK